MTWASTHCVDKMVEAIAPELTDKPKKRQKNGSKIELEKKRRLASHETGPDCNCSRHRCFTVTTGDERRDLISIFNGYRTKDEQDAYLSTLIKVTGIKRRRPREESQNSVPNECSYTYCLKVERNDKVEEIPVCAKGFASVFGITDRRIRTIKQALSTLGRPPTDQRGKHTNRPHKLNDELRNRIIDHISSFRGRMSHYAREKTRKLYLDAALNISKMFTLFTVLYPNVSVGYDSYRDVFNNNFNISFGYPRSDTCSKCDEFLAEFKSLDQALQTSPENPALLRKKANLVDQRELHHRKAETFYKRKRDAKSLAQSDQTVLAAAFDFQKDLPCPNKTTNDVYYRRQLTLHSFNIHELATDCVFIFTYDERIAKKRANDVASMLYFFIKEKVPDNVVKLELFCDSCGGQNENYTIIRFLYYLVHMEKRFLSIKVTFPIRGHSYMECDRDLAIVNKKADIELPSDWSEQFRLARCRPHPYNIIEMDQSGFFDFASFLKPAFKASCPMKTMPIREMFIRNEHPSTIHFRESWNAMFESAVVVRGTKQSISAAAKCAASQPAPLYDSIIPISQAKYRDLQVLKRFCRPEHHGFYDSLVQDGQLPDTFHQEDSESDSETD